MLISLCGRKESIRGFLECPSTILYICMTHLKCSNPWQLRRPSVVLNWLINQLDGEQRHLVAEFIMITSITSIVNNSTYFMTPHNITECKNFTLCTVSIALSWFLRSKKVGLVPGSSYQHLSIMSHLRFI